jgi:hypothetical protein
MTPHSIPHHPPLGLGLLSVSPGWRFSKGEVSLASPIAHCSIGLAATFQQGSPTVVPYASPKAAFFSSWTARASVAGASGIVPIGYGFRVRFGVGETKRTASNGPSAG